MLSPTTVQHHDRKAVDSINEMTNILLISLEVALKILNSLFSYNISKMQINSTK